MEANNVLSNDVCAFGPPTLPTWIVGKSKAGQVVEKGVKPDVGDVLGIKGQLNAPAESRLGSGDAQVIQGLAQEA